MSVRLLTTRLARHGRYLLQSYIKREINTNILEQNYNKTRNRCSAPSSFIGSRGANKPTSFGRNAYNATLNAGSKTAAAQASNGIFRFGQHARKLFIDNILNRVTNTFSEDLRSQATRKLFYGDSAPFFALVGVSLATGAGMLTKEDELEGVCWEIREAAGRLQSVWTNDELSENLDSTFNIDKLDIGPPIAKGCAAVVYAASIKDQQVDVSADISVENSEHPVGVKSPRLTDAMQPISTEMITPIQNISRFVHNFGGSVDNLNVYNQSPVAAAFNVATRQATEDKDNTNTSNNDVIPVTAVSSGQDALMQLNMVNADINRFPLALKMMFNYDIQSNALSILRAMYRETVPARQRYMNEYSEEWERLVQDQTLTIPPHPNIVCMYGFFCDEVRDFPDGNKLYPIAQPQRINPGGYGRNMSLFLLMKRYDYSLRTLLDSHELQPRTKLLLLAQLLEAVTHINRHGIAHRDLKSDNILIEINDDKSPPVLVLSDFGCCLADREHPLALPYTSFDMDKGGNAALMAPEIINKQPGPFAVLNYSKADLWACGAIAYEIFGLQNPFYYSSGMKIKNSLALRNSDYKETDLPPLSDDCPFIVQKLIHNILHPNPSKRLSPDIAANVMQLFLWAPSNWMKTDGFPNSPEILQWLLSLSTKLMSEGRHTQLDDETGYNRNGRRTYVEYLLIASFLARAQLRRIRKSLDWIHDII